MPYIPVRDRHDLEQTVSSWEIADFKSIESAKVRLTKGHLTVLAGANSVGKSSLLQSILMLCQSINYGDEIVLNGPLTKLGIPSEIVRTGSNSCHVGIEFKIHEQYDLRSSLGMKTQQAKATIELRPIGTVKPGLVSDGMAVSEIAIENSSGIKYDLSRRNARKSDEARCREHLGPRYAGCQLLKVAPLGENDLNRTYVVIRGVLPTAVISLKSDAVAKQECQQELEELLNGSAAGRRRIDLLRLALRILQNRGACDAGFSDRQGFSGLRSSFQKAVKSLGNEKDSFLSEVIELAYPSRSFEAVNVGRGWSPSLRASYDNDVKESKRGFWDLVTVLSGLVEALLNLSERVEYIGPLRDDPRVISPLTEESGKNLPIGRKGEKSASLLLSASKTVSMYGFPDMKGRRQSTLEDAVDAWAAYLGVAGEVRVSNEQKLGVSLHVSLKDGVERDLTMVGVGASQAIPILVGVLAAARGSIVIIEQPELHLHPSAQAKLADFFLEARPDLTLLIESHSEALVTRLRRRVVEDTNRAKRISLLFFAKSGASHGVKAKRLAIDEFGNLDIWPEGFMDAVDEDTRAIVRAAMDKRLAGRANGS